MNNVNNIHNKIIGTNKIALAGTIAYKGSSSDLWWALGIRIEQYTTKIKNAKKSTIGLTLLAST